MTTTIFSGLFLIVIMTVGVVTVTGAKVCTGDGWELQGKKCLKLFQGLLTQEEGVALCASEKVVGDPMVPQLLQVIDQTEQDFIVDTVFNSTLAPGLWLGAVRSNDNVTFTWLNGKTLSYTQWDIDSPSDTVGRGCVEMQSDLGRNNGVSLITPGYWKDVTCLKGNWVMCEKYPSWNVLDMIEAIIELQYDVEQLQNGISTPTTPSTIAPNTTTTETATSFPSSTVIYTTPWNEESTSSIDNL